MWTFKNLMGDSANWYTEEEYMILKEENEKLKKLLESFGINIDTREEGNDDM